MRVGNFHLNIATWGRGNRVRPCEIYRLILTAASGNLASCWIMTLKHNLNYPPEVPRVIDSLDLALTVKQYLKPLGLLAFRDRVDHGKRGRIGSRRVLETENAIVLHFGEEVHGLNKIVWGLAGKPDNNIGGDRDWPPCCLDPGNPLQIPLRGV